MPVLDTTAHIQFAHSTTRRRRPAPTTQVRCHPRTTIVLEKASVIVSSSIPRRGPSASPRGHRLCAPPAESGAVCVRLSQNTSNLGSRKVSVKLRLQSIMHLFLILNKHYKIEITDNLICIYMLLGKYNSSCYFGKLDRKFGCLEVCARTPEPIWMRVGKSRELD